MSLEMNRGYRPVAAGPESENAIVVPSAPDMTNQPRQVEVIQAAPVVSNPYPQVQHLQEPVRHDVPRHYMRPHVQQPVPHVVPAVPVVQATQVEEKSYTMWVGDTFSCFDNMGVCCFGFWCGPCMWCEVAADAYNNGVTSTPTCIQDHFISIGLTSMFKCAYCLCPRYFGPVFRGHVLVRFRQKYNLAPLNFGSSLSCWNEGFMGQYCFPDCWQMVCCGPCTICLMYRQMTAHNRVAVNYGKVYIPDSMYNFDPRVPQPQPGHPGMN
ncbi:hypothetical protein AAMO2058_000296800 [Amorphochlora amoebiformis]|mmetsp:Transcript_18072/g.28789  ORF Transcript_18072/g.28789 Transcript_18072/m.28789 type:complete len:267 (-) Transcript_18072:144-944(-)|eukprot:1315818-Amorphochlora_amoeboformis.AAC.1